jgi:hypothetical protein
MGKIFCAVMLMFAVMAVPKAKQPSLYQGHGPHPGMSMPMDAESMTPESQAKLLADRKESEFNHHLAGFFVALGACSSSFKNG